MVSLESLKCKLSLSSQMCPVPSTHGVNLFYSGLADLGHIQKKQRSFQSVTPNWQQQIAINGAFPIQLPLKLLELLECSGALVNLQALKGRLEVN